MLIWFLQRYLRRKFRSDFVLLILVSLFLVASESWLFKQGILLKKLEVAIRLGVPVILVIIFRKYVFPDKVKILFVLYGILSIYMLFISIFSENPNLVVFNSAKLLFILTFPVSLLLILHPNNFSYRFLYIPAYLGLFFSIQTIILFVLIQTCNSPHSDIVTLVGYKNMEVLSFKWWGYAHGMMAIGSPEQVYRAQSFFGEPTTFANFMETATILSFGLYRVRKDKKMLVISALCATSFVLTFSMTAYVAVFLAFCFYMIVVNWNKLEILAPVIVTITVLVVMTIVLLYFYVATHPGFYGQSRWGFAFGHSPREITIRLEALTNSLHLFMEHPFGIGLIGHVDSTILAKYAVTGATFAPLNWMMIAGIVGITVQLTILFYLFRNIVIKHIKMRGRIERYIALSFVTCVLHHCVAGSWFSALFFYLLVCLIVTDAYQFSFYSNHIKGLAKMDDSNIRRKRF